MDNVLFPTNCPVCHRELTHEVAAEYEPKVDARVRMFHRDDHSPICKGAFVPGAISERGES